MNFSQAFSSRGSELPIVISRFTQPLSSSFLDHLAHDIAQRNCRIVCIGEASHGTYEFYNIRAELTKRLIAEYGFDGVCIEGDWPDAWKVNQYVTGTSRDRNANESLKEFRRFPTWMWRNTVTQSFVEWLKHHNDLIDRAKDNEAHTSYPTHKAGFYGMDLYSLFTSIDAVIEYLDSVDKDAANRARDRFACFEQGSRGQGNRDAQIYGRNAAMGMSKSCEDAVLSQLNEMQNERFRANGDEFFSAQLNAMLVKDAENYYRGMFLGDEPSWNLRDQHMANTVHELIDYIERRKRESAGNNNAENVQQQHTRLVLWAHNSHLGDARATDMGTQRGELNVGQLMRQDYGDATTPLGCYNVGFTSYSGTVTAASNWDTPDRHMVVNPGRRGSWEELMHQAGDCDDFGLIIRGNSVLERALNVPRLERAIGVIYRPRTELQSHYFEAYLARQFDAVVHIDRSNAIEPLDPKEHWLVAKTEHLSLNPDHVPKEEEFNYEPGPRTLKAPFVEDHGKIPPETYPHNF